MCVCVLSLQYFPKLNTFFSATIFVLITFQHKKNAFQFCVCPPPLACYACIYLRNKKKRNNDEYKFCILHTYAYKYYATKKKSPKENQQSSYKQVPIVVVAAVVIPVYIVQYYVRVFAYYGKKKCLHSKSCEHIVGARTGLKKHTQTHTDTL